QQNPDQPSPHRFCSVHEHLTPAPDPSIPLVHVPPLAFPLGLKLMYSKPLGASASQRHFSLSVAAPIWEATTTASGTVHVNLSNQVSSNGNSSVATISASATALPPYLITRDDVKYYMGRVFDIPERRVEAMMAIVDNAQVH